MHLFFLVSVLLMRMIVLGTQTVMVPDGDKVVVAVPNKGIPPQDSTVVRVVAHNLDNVKVVSYDPEAGTSRSHQTGDSDFATPQKTFDQDCIKKFACINARKRERYWIAALRKARANLCKTQRSMTNRSYRKKKRSSPAHTTYTRSSQSRGRRRGHYHNTRAHRRLRNKGISHRHSHYKGHRRHYKYAGVQHKKRPQRYRNIYQTFTGG